MHLYIIRHGQTDFNVKGIVQGKGVNSPLNETGKAQSRAFFEAYQHHPFEAVLTSSLQRTKETVEAFINKGLIHYEYPELDEISWGIFEGKASTPELHLQYKNVLKAWSQGDYDARIPEGESALEMNERLEIWLDKMLRLPHQHLLICTHGATMSFLMTKLRGEALSEMGKYRHHNTGICKLSRQGALFHLEIENDIAHLA